MHKFFQVTFLALVIIFISTSVKSADLQKDFKKKEKRHIVFLITKDPDNYEADKTVPVFADKLRKKFGYRVSVLLGSGRSGAYRYPSVDAIKDADLLVVFARRIALPIEQMDAIKEYLKKGKPVVGIRTANHAFTVRETVEEGYQAWPEFVSTILGCENRGYGPVQPGTDVSIAGEAKAHPIMQGLSCNTWHSAGNIYLVAPLLDSTATVLLTGKVGNISQPIAWTRRAGRSKVFYTSLGYPDDFNAACFTTLLNNAIHWALIP